MPLPPPKKKWKDQAMFQDEHPYVIKLDLKLNKLSKHLDSIYKVADCDLILMDAKTGLNDFSANERFAKKLDDTAKKLAQLSHQLSEKATAVHDKIDAAIDTKAGLQDVQYVGEVLEYSQQCELIKKRNKCPQRFKASGKFRIKRETLDSSDDEDEEPPTKKSKPSKEYFSGDMDGHFQFPKNNENDPAAHHFICDICDSVFRDTNELQNHLSNHSMEFYRCLKCLKVFRSVRSFENHHVSHLQSHTCDTCGKFFQLKMSLTNHLQVHSTDRMKCSYPGCKKTFQFRQNQLEHTQWAHHKTKDCPCTHCPKMFQTPTSMRTHRLNVHGRVADITLGHPDAGRAKPRRPLSTRTPTSAAGSAKQVQPPVPQLDDDFDENVIGTLQIKWKRDLLFTYFLCLTFYLHLLCGVQMQST